MKISGKFEVKLHPLDCSMQGSGGAKLGRQSIDKTYRGELEASSKGEMLSAMTSVSGSAGYVAIEQVVGSLSGKQGSFVLQHFATMQNTTSELKIRVVPDSGTDELVGLKGGMAINIVKGEHYYEFDFQLAE